MNDTDYDILDRMLTDHGTHGLAEMLAEVCEERAANDEEPGMDQYWALDAQLFRDIPRSARYRTLLESVRPRIQDALHLAGLDPIRALALVELVSDIQKELSS